MPTLTLTTGAITSTTAAINISAFAADGTVEIQCAVRPDFKNCVCPIITGIALSSPYSLIGLTQDTPYYLRARSRRASGAAEDWSAILPFRTALAAGPDLSTPSILISPALIVVPVPVVEWTGLLAGDVAGYPCANLAFDAPVAWRSALTANVAAFRARISPQPVDTIALLMSNAPEDATVQVSAGNDPATTDYMPAAQPFRASANLNGRPGYHALVRLPSAQTYPYWKVTITCPTGLSGPFHLEHAVFGRNRTSKNHSVDKSEAPLDLGNYDRNRSGIPQRMLGLRGKRVDFEISLVNQLQFETLYADLPRLVGASDPVLVVPNTRAGTWLHDRILYGVLTGGKASSPASPVHSRSFTIDSILP
jgi:hypothetical protein